MFRWLFGKDPRSPVACLVRQQFPTVHRMVHRLKAGNYRRLAHRLQRIESQFLFDDVIPRLLARHPDTWMVSIHDSLLVRESDVGLARGAFTASFDDLGMHPKIH